MATFTQIDMLGNVVTQIKTALNAKSLITAVAYEDTDCLIFTTPLLPDSKVLKIKVTSSSFIMYYGDAWTSAETITNQKVFSTMSSVTIVNLYLIADTDWFVFIPEGTYHYFGYVGSLDNGDVIVAGFTSTNAGSYGNGQACYNVSQNLSMFPMSYYIRYQIYTPDWKFLKMPVMWYDVSGKTIVMNGTVPATTKGLSFSSWFGGAAVSDLGNTYYLSQTTGLTQIQATGTLYQVFYPGILLELDPRV